MSTRFGDLDRTHVAADDQAAELQAGSADVDPTVTDGDSAGITAALVEPAVPGSDDELRGAIEAILLVVDDPAPTGLLAQVVGLPEARILDQLKLLQRDYDDAGRGFELREVAGGWRMYTRAAFAAYVERFVLDGQHARLTHAALETLAVVAYRQPVSRTRVSAVRGVNVDSVMRTLMSRGLVEEAGTDSESGALLYRTSPYFLERLGLNSLAELPPLANYLPETTTIDALDDELSGGS
jgi:segregation and condensation protein B